MRESDEILRDELVQQLKDHPKIDSKHMQVDVHEGHVHLKGRADTEDEKALAEELAKSLPGVLSVRNDLHIDLGIIHAITSLVSGISAATDEELHPKKNEDKPGAGNKDEPVQD